MSFVSKFSGALLAAAFAANPSFAQDAAPQILFTNVNVFDGVNESLIENANVLVQGNLIAEVSTEPLAAANALIIDGGGRTLMPGMHDMHTHIGISRPPAGEMRLNMDPFLVGVVAAKRAEFFLMNGFTTIRDIGGPAKFMQRAIDTGVVIGPRILPTEAFISQTAGHGDFRNRSDLNPNMYSRGTQNFVDEYYTCLADGLTEIRRCVREQMGLGAVQVKIFTGGGISSEKDPLHAVQYTAAEVQAAVEVANQYGTYVAAHAYTVDHIQLAVDNGVKVIEHGALLTPEIAEQMVSEDIWLVPSFKAFVGTDLEAFAQMASPAQVAKATIVAEGAEAAYRTAVEKGVKMAFGTDLLGPWEQAGVFEKQVYEEFYWAAQYMPDVDVLRMATGLAGELHALTGENSPYQEGPTGVIQEGAYADILLVKGNPADDVQIMANPDDNLDLIMKDGMIYKNRLEN